MKEFYAGCCLLTKGNDLDYTGWSGRQGVQVRVCQYGGARSGVHWPGDGDDQDCVLICTNMQEKEETNKLHRRQRETEEQNQRKTKPD